MANDQRYGELRSLKPLPPALRRIPSDDNFGVGGSPMPFSKLSLASPAGPSPAGPSPKRKSSQAEVSFEPAAKVHCPIAATAVTGTGASSELHALPSISKLLEAGTVAAPLPAVVQNLKTIGSENDERLLENDERLLCFCRKPYDASQAYVACEHCGQWYHYACVSAKCSDSLHLPAVFVCEQCSFEYMQSEAPTETCSSPSSSSDSFSLLLSAAVEARQSRSTAHPAAAETDIEAPSNATFAPPTPAPPQQPKPYTLRLDSDGPSTQPRSGRRGRSGRGAGRANSRHSEPLPVTPVRAYLREALCKPRPSKPEYNGVHVVARASV